MTSGPPTCDSASALKVSTSQSKWQVCVWWGYLGSGPFRLTQLQVIWPMSGNIFYCHD